MFEDLPKYEPYKWGLEKYKKENDSNVYNIEKIMAIKHTYFHRKDACKYCRDERDGLAFPPISKGVYRCMCPLGEKSKYQRYPILGPVEMKEWE